MCRPGVSRKTNWLSPRFRMAQIRFRVVWGLLETMATFSPTRALVRVDLPTLGRPTIEIIPDFLMDIAFVPQLSFPAV